MKYNNFELITIIAIYTFIFPFSVQAQLMSDGSFESAGAALGSGNPFLAYPSFTNDWTTVNVDGEVFNDGNAFDGNWYADLLQNAGQNLNTFWDEANHTSSGYDRILTSITDLTPNTEYMVIFYHSTQLNRYGYLADQTLVQIQSVQTNDANSYAFNTPTTNIWEPDTVNFITDSLTNSVYLLFSPLGLNNTSVSIDKISITHSGNTTGIGEIVQENEIKIYPNPTSNSLIANSQKEIQTINIYNIEGIQVLNIENPGKDFEISMTQFPAGIYTLISTDSDGNRQMRKIIKK
tara:strand:+ start:33 stop:908 length:876 start_codon:yes stop_codon:yes gene_type:complete